MNNKFINFKETNSDNKQNNENMLDILFSDGNMDNVCIPDDYNKKYTLLNRNKSQKITNNINESFLIDKSVFEIKSNIYPKYKTTSIYNSKQKRINPINCPILKK